MKQLQDETYLFHPDLDKTNHYVHFTVPEGAYGLQFECSYSPKRVEPELAEKAILRNIGKYMPRPQLEEIRKAADLKPFLPVVNLITFSLDCGNDYVGCAHRHHQKQTLIVSPKHATPGFFRRAATPGPWTAVVNIHSITSEEVAYHLVISTLEEGECPDD